jgi:hypothetical protein
MKNKVILLVMLAAVYSSDIRAQYTVDWLSAFQFPTPASDSRGEDLVVDADGNVYLNGRFDSTMQRQVVVKYDATGVEQWRKAFSWDISQAWRMFLSPSGQVLSAGQYENNTGTNDMNFLAYSPTGVRVSSAIYNSPATFSNDEFRDAAMDSKGNIYLAGTLVPTPGSSRAGLARFDTGAQYRWASSFANLPGWSSAQARAIELSGDTAAYLWVLNFSGFGSVIKYDSAGVFKWQKQLPLSTAGVYHTTLAVSPDDGSAIVGSSRNNKCAIAKLTPLGDTAWTRTFASAMAPANMVGEVRNVQTDSDGNIYALGEQRLYPADYSVLVKFSPAGTMLWSDTLYRIDSPFGKNNEWMTIEEGRITIAVQSGYSSRLYQWDLQGTQLLNTPLILPGLTMPEVGALHYTGEFIYMTGSVANGSNARRGFTARLSLPVPLSVTAVANVSAICAGGTVVFSATATGAGAAPTYQWRQNSAAIAGATGASYSSTSVTNGDVFDAIVTSSLPGSAMDTSASLLIAVTNTNTWTGTGGNNLWSNGDNWSCGAAPTLLLDAIIPGGAAITIDSTLAACNLLMIGCCAPVSLTGAGHVLHAATALVNDGTLNVGDVTIEVEEP